MSDEELGRQIDGENFVAPETGEKKSPREEWQDHLDAKVSEIRSKVEQIKDNNSRISISMDLAILSKITPEEVADADFFDMLDKISSDLDKEIEKGS